MKTTVYNESASSLNFTLSTPQWQELGSNLSQPVNITFDAETFYRIRANCAEVGFTEASKENRETPAVEGSREDLRLETAMEVGNLLNLGIITVLTAIYILANLETFAKMMSETTDDNGMLEAKWALELEVHGLLNASKLRQIAISKLGRAVAMCFSDDSD